MKNKNNEYMQQKKHKLNDNRPINTKLPHWTTENPKP